MVIQRQRYTLEQFEAFVDLPENAEKMFEFIGGEIVEVPSNPFASFIGSIILGKLIDFVLENDLGYVTGEQGGYMVGGERYAPDVAFISNERQPELATSGYNPNPPDLVVEVVSSDRNDERDKLRVKITNYLAVGTVVWLVRPDDKRIEVHAPGQQVQTFDETDTITGDDVLPGFELPLSDVFRK